VFHQAVVTEGSQMKLHDDIWYDKASNEHTQHMHLSCPIIPDHVYQLVKSNTQMMPVSVDALRDEVFYRIKTYHTM